MKSYRTSPANKAEATKRAKELKAFLEKHTGVKWEIRVWQNLGWHLSALSGTISITPHYYIACAPTFLLMNSADGVRRGTGNVELNSYNANSPTELIKAISSTLNDQKKFVERYIAGYNSNAKMKQFTKLQ